ncbi:MAG: glycine cleavage system protein GcvH [Planctomycetota bacterium]|nr:MAG: glycine cleavage system protein GcvH [Planctomycetota bacterium]
MIPKELKYTESHEWVRVEDGIAVVGITDHAQHELGDIVFVELPETDAEYGAGEAAATVESVKAASDIYSPLSGRVVEVNEALEDSPELVNKSPYGDGWIFKIEISDPSELDALLDADAYAKHIGE